MMRLALLVLKGAFSICRLDPGTSIPNWALAGDLCSISITPDELSIVCRQEAVPAGVRSNDGWKCIKVQGPLDFSLTGVLASLAAPLAGAGISVFAFSTYDTDYMMVKEADLKKAIVTLEGEGHIIRH